MRFLPTFAIAVLFSLSGCVEQNERSVSHPAQRDAYETNVHPWIAPSCGSLDCHGERERPYSIYSLRGLRAGERTTSLSEEERMSNFEAIIGIDFGAPTEDSLLLTKPLAETAGGVSHVGGELWSDENSAEYRCVRAFLVNDHDVMTNICPTLIRRVVR